MRGIRYGYSDIKDEDDSRQNQQTWQDKARAAGWSPPKFYKPVDSRLRVVEKCKECDGTGSSGRDILGNEIVCMWCYTGTIERPLTPEEVVEVAEGFVMYCEDMHLGDKYLASGLKVILVEGNDA